MACKLMFNPEIIRSKALVYVFGVMLLAIMGCEKISQDVRPVVPSNITLKADTFSVVRGTVDTLDFLTTKKLLGNYTVITFPNVGKGTLTAIQNSLKYVYSASSTYLGEDNVRYAVVYGKDTTYSYVTFKVTEVACTTLLHNDYVIATEGKSTFINVVSNDIICNNSSIGLGNLLPKHGNITLDTTGNISFKYTPGLLNGQASVVDSFSYMVCAKNKPSDCKEAKVYIKINPDSSCFFNFKANTDSIGIPLFITFAVSIQKSALMQNDVFCTDDVDIPLVDIIDITNSGGSLVNNPTRFIFKPKVPGYHYFSYRISSKRYPGLYSIAKVKYFVSQ